MVTKFNYIHNLVWPCQWGCV